MKKSITLLISITQYIAGYYNFIQMFKYLIIIQQNVLFCDEKWQYEIKTDIEKKEIVK